MVLAIAVVVFIDLGVIDIVDRPFSARLGILDG